MRRFLALPLVLRWCLVGATLPSALWSVVIAIGAVTEGFSSGLLPALESTVMALGFLMLMIVIVGAPGALLGLAVGSVDLALGKHVERNRGSGRAVAAACATMTASLVLASFLLQLLISSGLSVVAWVVTSAAFAAVPATITCFRYVRIAKIARSPKIGPEPGTASGG